MKYFVILIFLFLLLNKIVAQGQGNNWYFGQNAGVNFNTNPPTSVTGSLVTQEGCSSISTAAGNLLFYTDGITVYNSNHAVMANGTGLLGNSSTAQSGVIVKQPGNTNIYYIFTMGVSNNGDLNYSVVDMSLAAGMGSVTIKNVYLHGPCLEKLTAVLHTNNQDAWILVHESGTSTNFRAYLLTSTGVNTTAVISSVGGQGGLQSIGYLRGSPSGIKVASGYYNNAAGGVELYDFNRTTGVLSNPLFLNASHAVYGVEFSPDGTKLYGSGGGTIWQWNLCAGSATAIASSLYSFNATSNWAVQLAPNGKIYVAQYQTQFLGVINNPNVAGAGCNYAANSVSLSPNACRLGLPNYITNTFLPPSLNFTVTMGTPSNNIGCNTASFTAPPPTSIVLPGCGALTSTLSSFVWNFGDPSSGSNNTSTLSNPIHQYSTIGTYTPALILFYNNNTLTDTIRQVITFNQLCVNVVSSSVTCSSLGTATVQSQIGVGPHAYTWMPSNQTGSIASGLGPGTYTITVFDVGANFTFSTTVTFTSPTNYYGNLTQNGILNCHGISNGTAAVSVIGGSGNQSYFWTDGVTSQTNVVATGLGIGIHTVVVTDALTACTFTQSFMITQPPALTLQVAVSVPTACVGNSVSLTSSVSGGTPGYSHIWTGVANTASAEATHSVAGTHQFTFTATDSKSCTITNTVAVNFVANPQIVAPSVSICPNESATLTASGASSFTWQPGNIIASTFTDNPTVTSSYSLFGTLSGCSASISPFIFVKPVPTLTFSTYSITCANLGSATVTANGGVGPYSYTWTPTLQTTPIATNLNPNTYTLSVFDLGTNCTSTSTTVFNSLIPLDGTLLNTSSLTCNGVNNVTAAIVNITGGTPVQNYIWTDGVTTFTNSNPLNLGAGNWSVTVSDALTGCQVYSVFTITQPPASTLNLSANISSVCVGGSVVLTGTNSGGTSGYTYTWTNGPQNDTYTVNEVSAGTFSYELISSDANNCTTSNTINVDFVPNPTITVASISICPQQVGFINASGASTYTWSNLSNSSGIADSPTVTTQYTVTGSALGCTSTALASIILKPVPAIILSSNSPRCENSSLLLQTISTNTTPLVISYNWSGPQNFTSTLQSPLVSTISILQAGVYHLTVTAANSCTAGASSTVVVNPVPPVSATGNTVCTSQTLTLNSNSIPGASFLWSGPIGFSSTQQNPSIVNPILNRSGVYFVRATSAQGCTNIATATVSVISPPLLTVGLSSMSLCSQPYNGSRNTVTVNVSGANTYSIYTNHFSGNGAFAGSSVAINPIPPLPSSLVLSTATIVGSNGVCTSAVNRTISIIPNPTVILATTPSICAGTAYTYTLAGAGSYQWSSATPHFTTYQGGAIAVTQPSLTTAISVIGSSLLCQSDSQTSTITVVPLPIINLSPTQPSICLNEKIDLTAFGTGVDFEWFPAEGLDNTFGMTVSASPTITKNYSVVASANTCTNIASTTITVFALPQPTIISLKEKLCVDETITLKGAGGESYEWFGPQNIYYQRQEINFKAASVNLSGDFTLTVTDSNGCKANVVKLINIQALPSGVLEGFTAQACAPDCGDYRFRGTSQSASILGIWKIGEQVFNGQSFSHCFYVPGTYTIKGFITDTTSTCTNALTYEVQVNPKPEADFYFTPNNPIENVDDVMFVDNTFGEELNKWSWLFSDDNTLDFETKNVVRKFKEAGLYTTVMQVTNKWNCSDTAIKTIVVEPDFSIYIPNAFTPNNDGLNDDFKPVIRSVQKYNLKIFDRWGHLIFESSEIDKGWDGTNRAGVNSKSEVYTWQIEITSLHGENKALSGHVTLLR